MQPEQEVIADWMRRVMSAREWTPRKWAIEAKVDPTTITRAIDPEYKSVTSVKTLNVLAKAAGEQSVLDHLKGAHATPTPATLPSEETLARLLSAIVPLAPKGRSTAQSLRVLSSALLHGLELLGDQSATPNNDAALGVAARGAVARLRDLTRQ